MEKLTSENKGENPLISLLEKKLEEQTKGMQPQDKVQIESGLKNMLGISSDKSETPKEQVLRLLYSSQ